MITAASSLVEVAFEVCTAMDGAGFTVVMTGGSAATYHAPDAYQSLDIDFVIHLAGDHGEDALRAIGYVRQGQHYAHQQSPFPIDFPKGPLAVGRDLVSTWLTDRRGKQLLHVLSPTDSCRDRLMQYFAWDDFSGLEQALAVATAQRDRVDLELIRDWSEREGSRAKYDLFVGRLRHS